jgi:Mrp family chromosome partitioning ATPase
MSKIEEALNKARSDNSTGLVKTSTSIQVVNSDISLMEHDEKVGDDVLSKLKIIHYQMKDRKIFSEFRALRTKLIEKSDSSNLCIMIYSSSPGAGSSYVAANLAAAIALDEEKTSLLVNCDFTCKPDYEKLINNCHGGLVDYLSSDISAEEIIYSVGIKRLRIIPAGSTKETFSEYFTLRRFQELLAEIKSRYQDRYIILDAPSAMNPADIRLLSEFIDYGLLVAPYGKDSFDNINKATRLISQEKMIGVVINNKPGIFIGK